MVDCLRVPFYFGLGSRYSYLAATQLDRIEEETGCIFDWMPLCSSDLIQRANNGRTPFKGNRLSGQYDLSYRERDAAMWARFYDIPYTNPAPASIEVSDFAKACWAMPDVDTKKLYSVELMKMVFSRGEVVTHSGLARVAAEVGIPAKEFQSEFESPETDTKHQSAMSRALDDGVFGVPSFVVRGSVIWGNDRLPLLKMAIMEAQEKMAH